MDTLHAAILLRYIYDMYSLHLHKIHIEREIERCDAIEHFLQHKAQSQSMLMN